eukprot:12893540-Prorocentrum_lima.AAC.1
MKRVMNAAFGPHLTICKSFRTLAMGGRWDSSPKLSSRFIPSIIPATIPTNSASHDDRAVTLCFPDRQDIRLGPWYIVTSS